MSENPDIVKELKGLGAELAKALKQIRSSREFKDLQKEVTTGVKKISASLIKSIKAAQKSQSTQRLKTRLHRVAKAGKIQGTAEAQRARVVVTKGLRRARTALKQVSKDLHR